MTISVRQALDKDAPLWNNYVNSHPQATPYHHFGWLTSTCNAYCHENASYLVFEEENLVGIVPLIKFKGPFGKYKYCALPFCDTGHALTSSGAAEQKIRELLQALSRQQIVEYRATSPKDADELEQAQLENSKVSMILPLPDTSEELLKSFKSKLRSQIRKAEKNGLHYQVGHTPTLLQEFYQVFVENMRKLGSPVHSFSWFTELFKSYADAMLISVVYSGDLPVGGAIVLVNKDKACIPWASTLAEYNRLAPNMLLYWSVLAHTTDAGCKEFDFGRSTYNEGTYKFKQQWGAKPRPLDWRLPHEQVNEQITESAPAKKGRLRLLVERVWPKLPLSVTNYVGPKIRKYISL